MNRETAIMRNIRTAINRTGRARVVRNTNGQDRLTFVVYGLGDGSPDLVGILKSGRAIAIEVKTPIGSLRDDQKAWMRVFRKFGGFAAVACSVPEALAAITRAEEGLDQ